MTGRNFVKMFVGQFCFFPIVLFLNHV